MRDGFDGAAGGDGAKEGDALLRFLLLDQADAAVGAVYGFYEAGLDQGLDVFVQGASGGQAEGLAEFVEGWRMIEKSLFFNQIVIDLLLAAG